MTNEIDPDGTAEDGLGEPAPTTSTQTPAPEVPEKEAAPVEPQEAKYVTAEQLERRDAELLRRFKQSSSDRAKQIEKQFDEIRALLTKDAPLTPQQELVLRQKIEQDVDGQTQGMQSDAVPPEVQAQADYVYSQIDETFADIGMRVGPNDKEWTQLQTALEDPRGSLAKTLRAAAKASEAKAARVSLQKNNAQARVVSGGGERTSDPNNISNITDPKLLYQMGEKKLGERK